ncbi:conjugal transfer protein TraD [Rhizobium miluonense]|uniref:Conjugal transfer protein TraD n=1 Tax=Rhizobium miluonense TaxID=411945 RepID=A0A1C3W3E5_9HYPH|nr:conjugal transfer protein TraD [Rhizobium miluonense]SCB34500.1 Conjugal transfer protein TraD [Rhizobium miluonense]
MTNYRKRETRDKIIFGGLIIKAGLRKADRAFLLGALIEASRIPSDTAQYHHLREIGMEAFRTDARMTNSESKDLT